MSYLDIMPGSYPGMYKIRTPKDPIFREGVIKAHPSRRWHQSDLTWEVGASRLPWLTTEALAGGWDVSVTPTHPAILPYTLAPDAVDWATLLDYQRRDVALALRDGIRFLFYTTGAGKSLGAISILKALRPKALKKKLIVCPANVRLNWEKQFALWGYDAPFTLIESGKDLEAVIHPEATIVTSFELLKKLPSQWRYCAIVIDEMHALIHQKSNRSKALAMISELNPHAMRVGLTATPISAEAPNIYNQVHTLCPYYFGTFPAFRDYYFETKAGYEGHLIIDRFNSDRTAEFRSHLGRIGSRITHADLAARGLLPEWKLSYRLLPGSEIAKASRTIRGWVKEQRKISSARAAAVADDVAVIEAVAEAQAGGAPVCFLSYLRSTAKAVGEALGIEVTHGGDTPRRRYNKLEKASVISCTLSSVREGIDLTRYHRVFLVEAYPVPLFITQVLGRFLRLNSKVGPQIDLLGLSNTGDELILDKLKRRIEEQDQLIRNSAAESELQKALTLDVDSDEFLSMLSKEFGAVDWSEMEASNDWASIDLDDVEAKET